MFLLFFNFGIYPRLFVRSNQKFGLRHESIERKEQLHSLTSPVPPALSPPPLPLPRRRHPAKSPPPPPREIKVRPRRGLTARPKEIGGEGRRSRGMIPSCDNSRRNDGTTGNSPGIKANSCAPGTRMERSRCVGCGGAAVSTVA